jgi:glycosyltransferase involved in cell wall biosynthesis
MAKFSIIIPAYNSERLLPLTLRSALDQTVREIEVIVVDDGSSDGTADAARAFEGVEVITQVNAGDSAARNAGLARASGEFVQFLDHDDLLHPEAIARHMAAFEARPEIDMVIGSNLIISQDGALLGENRQAVRVFSGRDIAINTVPSFSQSMYRRAALDRIGGFRPEARSCADHDLNIRLLADRPAGYCHGRMVMSYRRHPAQQTRSPTRLYRNHMEVLRAHFGPGGILEDPAYLAEVTRRWKRYHGQFMPSEMVRMTLQGRAGDAMKSLGAFLGAQPQAGLGAATYLRRRLAGEAR